MTRLQLATLIAFLAAAMPARSEIAPDWYAGMMSDQGIEVQADARVFTLFAAFNALGYDAGPVARREPFPRPALDEARQTVRVDAPMSAALASQFQAFLDAHPLPLRVYVAFASALGAPPDFALGSEPAESAPLRGLEQLLARYYREAHLDALYQKLLPQYRAALKGYLPRLDDALQRADGMLQPQPGDIPPPVLVVNLLDAPGKAYGLRRGGSALLVVGPGADGKPEDLGAAVAAYAGVRAGAALAERASAIKGLPELVERVHRQGLPDGDLSPSDYLTACFSLAVAAQALPDFQQAAFARAAAEGCWLTEDLSRSLVELIGDKGPGGNPFESFVTERLGSLDVRKLSMSPPGADAAAPPRHRER
ncbi:MAG TPA: hypothetical protein VMB50_20010 [Myxococcales bacterium]|nr:hypothetical protein [Myxococcales bacterium]